MNKLNVLKKGDIFSESSHYIYEGIPSPGYCQFRHKESNTTVNLSSSYVVSLLSSADQYEQQVEVTKEDKQNGDKGIRSIWQGIHNKDVFTVCFRKQDTPLSLKKFNGLKEQQVFDAVHEIEKAQKGKTGVAKKALEILKQIQDNPILPYEPGEQRILRGYKIDFESRDGKYRCVDMDLLDESGDDLNAVRPVNINTIEWLIYHGVKYIVK